MVRGDFTEREERPFRPVAEQPEQEVDARLDAALEGAAHPAIRAIGTTPENLGVEILLDVDAVCIQHDNLCE
jgi:hypothetical protein